VGVSLQAFGLIYNQKMSECQKQTWWVQSRSVSGDYIAGVVDAMEDNGQFCVADLV
jgi:hypothetical protein